MVAQNGSIGRLRLRDGTDALCGRRGDTCCSCHTNINTRPAIPLSVCHSPPQIHFDPDLPRPNRTLSTRRLGADFASCKRAGPPYKQPAATTSTSFLHDTTFNRRSSDLYLLISHILHQLYRIPNLSPATTANMFSLNKILAVTALVCVVVAATSPDREYPLISSRAL
jgi:hypothetical protein